MYRVANPWSKQPSIGFGKWYIDGNYVDENAEVTNNNWKGVIIENGKTSDVDVVKVNASPFQLVPVNMQPAKEAYESVLKNVGAVLPKRDTLDERIINEVKNRTGRMIDVQGGYPHGTSYEQTVNAWPTLNSLPALKDSDSDGMPDEWEKKNGLNPNDNSDASINKLDKFYTNIEVYINGLVKQHQ